MRFDRNRQIFIFNPIWPDGEGAGVTGEVMGGRGKAMEQRTEPAEGATPDQGT